MLAAGAGTLSGQEKSQLRLLYCHISCLYLLFFLFFLGHRIVPAWEDFVRIPHTGNVQLVGLKLPGLKLPGLKLPGLKLPGLQLPGLKLPGLKLPGLKLPGLKLS